LTVYLLGTVEFRSALQLQEQLLLELAASRSADGILLLCEHPPTLTMGREASLHDLSVSPQELERLGIAPQWLSRGGGAILHAPGQLAIYPLLPLAARNLGLLALREGLLESLLEGCQIAKIAAEPSRCRTQVFARTGPVGFVGAAVRAGFSHHGAFLNVSPDPNWSRYYTVPTEDFAPGTSQRIRASSFASAGMRLVAMNWVREAILRQLAATFGFERYHVFTGHPWLRRLSQKV